MSHTTHQTGHHQLTSDEHAMLVKLLKHPKIHELAKEIEDKQKKEHEETNS